eukprot:EG_transcript_58503
MLFLFSIWSGLPKQLCFPEAGGDPNTPRLAGHRQATTGSGALGTLVSSFVEAPSEMLMKQMQTKQSRGTMQALRTVFCSPGSGSRLLNSWLVLLSRELPFGSFQFAFYEASML